MAPPKKSDKVRKLVPLKVGDEWMEDRRLQRSEETGNSVGHYAHPETGANNLCHGLASGVLRTSHEGTAGALGKNLLRSCLGECELPVDRAVG
ncbi:hypothetical protein AXG93_1007s1000 [Marchantia polymorpha subsp. ruderalis]|uniref:Uncharacterized protein n=1 Tax=Marchantia polymorpha subsp. ruderalis TaxID=1480154 RepID=A0A176VZK8_MARPO|nr:hypothetical protein AXG93_1007s1000 [Marchantia polymorpha subsp. ruderalis]